MKKILKTSEAVKLLENSSVKEYTLYSNVYLNYSGVIEINKIIEYYGFVKSLNLKSNVKKIGYRSDDYNLESNYRGWLFKVVVQDEKPKTKSIINKLEKESLIIKKNFR